MLPANRTTNASRGEAPERPANRAHRNPAATAAGEPLTSKATEAHGAPGFVATDAGLCPLPSDNGRAGKRCSRAERRCMRVPGDAQRKLENQNLFRLAA